MTGTAAANPTAAANRPTRLARVLSVQDAGGGIRTFSVTTEDFPCFLPGQFVRAQLVGEQGQAGPMGCLTLAGSPVNRERLDFAIKDSGEFGSDLCRRLDSGAELLLSGPLGKFTLPMSREPICFLARDYAVPAARSMVNYLAHTGSSRAFILVHEVSDPELSLYGESWAGAPRWFRRYEITLTARPKGLELAQLRTWIPKPAAVRFLITGEGGDVKRLRGVVDSLGAPESQILTESWS